MSILSATLKCTSQSPICEPALSSITTLKVTSSSISMTNVTDDWEAFTARLLGVMDGRVNVTEAVCVQ